MALRGLTVLIGLYGSIMIHTTIEVPLFPQMMEEATREAHPFRNSSDEEHKEKETW